MHRYIFIAGFLFFSSSFSYAADDMVVKLPEPKRTGKVSLEETIERRRSERSLSGKGLTLEEISQLLWACQGITDRKNRFRSAPSAGATYPLEIYLASIDGLFSYLPDTHSIKRLKNDDVKEGLARAAYGQSFVKDAAIAIIICADFTRTTSRYGKRGENYVYMEVGHAAENLHLQAVSQGLGSVPVGAFSDDRVKEILSLPDNINPIYIIPVGYIEK